MFIAEFVSRGGSEDSSKAVRSETLPIGDRASTSESTLNTGVPGGKSVDGEANVVKEVVSDFDSGLSLHSIEVESEATETEQVVEADDVSADGGEEDVETAAQAGA